MTRGVKRDVDNTISDLQAQYFKYNNKNVYMQLGVRPMQLWEFAFPKESLPVMLKTLCPGNSFDPKTYKYKQLTALRLLLNAKKIPAMDLSQSPMRIIAKKSCAIYPIGIKEDGVWGSDTDCPHPDIGKGDELI